MTPGLTCRKSRLTCSSRTRWPEWIRCDWYHLCATRFRSTGLFQRRLFQADVQTALLFRPQLSCEQMTFALDPGPLVPKGGNFVLDFDDPESIYGSGRDRSPERAVHRNRRDTTGDRVEMAAFAQGFATPIPAVPEPAHYAGLLAGVMALAIYAQRRRNSQAR